MEQGLISRSNREGSSDPDTDLPQIGSSNLLSYQKQRKAATTPFKDPERGIYRQCRIGAVKVDKIKVGCSCY